VTRASTDGTDPFAPVPETMKHQTTRRKFLKNTTAIAAGVWVAARDGVARAVSPNERLQIGVIGVGRRGRKNLDDLLGVKSAQVVALCDVDDEFLAEAAEACPDASQHRDFRKMLESEKSLDAVLVATADHTHAPASLMALNLGKHVYCEKPLAHNVFEARRLTEAARKNNRVTQLGTQIHASENYRRVIEIIRSGAIGPVRDVHVIVNKIWGAEKPKPTAPWPPVPANLDYDLWLGPAEAWPYHPEWYRGRWRQWWNFGNGTIGDMGCHYMDLPFWALDLRPPTKISAEGRALDLAACPVWMIVRYDFPERGSQPPVKLTWYDGGKQPPELDDWGLSRKEWDNGVVFVGDKGILAANYTRWKLLPEKQFAGFQPLPPSIPRSIGHHAEWVEACLMQEPALASCEFDYSGPLSEAVLLGAVAYRTGKTLEWDAKNLKATNAPEADQFIRRAYRKGWEIV
jgi:predicted dehydrogenase